MHYFDNIFLNDAISSNEPKMSDTYIINSLPKHYNYMVDFIWSVYISCWNDAKMSTFVTLNTDWRFRFSRCKQRGIQL